MPKYQTQAFTGRKPIVLPNDASPQWSTVDVEFNPTAVPYIVGDLIEACVLPIGVKCLDWFFVAPDIDTGSLAFSLGVQNAGGTDLSAEVWGTGITAASTGVPFRNALSASAQGSVADNRTISLRCTTAPTAYSGGGRVGQLVMLLQG